MKNIEIFLTKESYKIHPKDVLKLIDEKVNLTIKYPKPKNYQRPELVKQKIKEHFSHKYFNYKNTSINLNKIFYNLMINLKNSKIKLI